jgi:hypothetical protein
MVTVSARTYGLVPAGVRGQRTASVLPTPWPSRISQRCPWDRQNPLQHSRRGTGPESYRNRDHQHLVRAGQVPAGSHTPERAEYACRIARWALVEWLAGAMKVP